MLKNNNVGSGRDPNLHYFILGVSRQNIVYYRVLIKQNYETIL